MPKTKREKERGTKKENAKHEDEKQKKRAKGLNKNAPPRRAQKANF